MDRARYIAWLLTAVFLVACAAGVNSGVPPSGPLTEPTASPEAALNVAVGELASSLGIAPGALRVLQVESVEWPDTSLGSPEPDTAYAQVITPGYRITVEVDGETYQVHTDLGERAVLPSDPQPRPRPAPGEALRSFLAHLRSNDVGLQLPADAAWLLEDAPEPGAATQQIWAYSSGQWHIEVSKESGAAGYRGVLTHADQAMSRTMRLDVDGRVEVVQSCDLISAQEAFERVLQHLLATAPGYGVPALTEWVLEEPLPQGNTATWRSGSWRLLVTHSTLPDRICSAELRHKQAGTVWRGRLNSSGLVFAEGAMLLTYEVSGCETSTRPDDLGTWSGVDVEVRDGVVYIAQRLAYTCCAELALAVGRDGSAIKVIETNVGQVCRCMCRYQVAMELDGLLPGDYVLELWGVQYDDMHPLESLHRVEVSLA